MVVGVLAIGAAMAGVGVFGVCYYKIFSHVIQKRMAELNARRLHEARSERESRVKLMEEVHIERT